MAQELFDVVDERDRVVGRAPRSEVHRRGLLHRAVHALVFDPAGRVFLQKRSMRKDTAPGCWDSSCSGHVDAGEDYDQAVVRELREEIGVVVREAPERWFRIAACAQTGWEFVWVYRLRHEGPFILAPEEIDRGQWFGRDELARAIAAEPESFALSFRRIWSEALGRPPDAFE